MKLETKCIVCGNSVFYGNSKRIPKSCSSVCRSKVLSLSIQNKWKDDVYKNKCKISISNASKGKKMSKEQKAKLSNIAKDRNLGGVRQSKRIDYNGTKLGSSYELIVAKSLDDYNIRWVQPLRFKYIDPFGKERYYTPDFYLPDYDIYLDPKNDFLINNINPSLGYSDIDKIKIVETTHKIKILILDKNNLTVDKFIHRIS